MTISTRRNSANIQNATHLSAISTEGVAIDRERAIDAWIAEIYQAAMQPRGWRSFLVSLAEALRLEPLAVIAIGEEGRELRHIPLQEGPERSALARLAPNLRAARALREQLGQLRLERDATAQVLDRLPVGVLIVDARARIVKCNRAACEILALGDGIQQCEGLQAANATDHSAMRAAIANAACEDGERGTSERLNVVRPSGTRPWIVEISRVARQAQLPAALVVIGDGEAPTRPLPEALQSHYGLTRAESELTMLLVAGQSLEQAANSRTVSRNTARGQLKRIFVKTGTNRQAELVRLVLAGPMGLAAEN